MTTAQVQAVQAAPVTVLIDETTPPAPIDAVAFAEAGGLACAWGGTERVDDTRVNGLVVRVLPDAAADYATWAATLPAGDATLDGYGDQSRVRCRAAEWPMCSGGVLVGDYWIDLLYTNGRGPSDEGAVVTDFESLITPMVAAVRGAGQPRPAWQAPAGGLDVAKFCDDPERIATSIGMPADQLELSSVETIGGTSQGLVFTPHLIPMTRGILATIYCKGSVDTQTCLAAAREFYAGRSFVKVTDRLLHSKWAYGSNNVFVSYACDPARKLVMAFGAIDNLGKGAAGQALQNANLMYDLPESTGLEGVALWP